MWVFNKGTGRMQQRDITFVPGLYKIFDEIVVNAADNKQRDPTMDRIEVTVDQETNTISVWNNGNGIPVVLHSEHKMYVPELIFGHLLTGSNFDDDEKKTTGGRNGYGAKLANIFSTEFVVETADSASGKKFKQVFSDNMGSKATPRIGAHSGSDYTKITFTPDLARFKMDCLDDDTVALLCKRVFDIAGCCNSYAGSRLQVYLNGKKLQVKSFQEYMGLYDSLEPVAAWEKVGDRWEIGVGPSDGQFTQVSFVNSICTTKGGQHANYVADKVIAKLAAIVKRKNKGEEVKGHFIKNHLAVYINCLIENPAFDSQTKESLTTRSSAFGSTLALSDKFFKAVEKSPVIDKVLSWAKFKQNEQLKRKGGAKKSKLTGITKLDDANFAGTAKGKDCTLILTEGDSAKSLAVSGLSIVGRDYFGVFPLKGKLLNVREANHGQIMNNEEIQNICKIMGLRHGVEYTDTKDLRYGHLLIMADQDHDGSHIKGLLINFIHHFWPSLLGVPGFMQQFITPIVRATKSKKDMSFFTVPEYHAWKEAQPGSAKGWTVKYFKGLGTSSAKDAKEYFSMLEKHRINFEAATDPAAMDSVDMAFSKKRVQDRKNWLTAFVPGTFVDYSVAEMTYEDFVNKELVLFSMADNQRSIPSLMDGFKPSQRKVLFACFKRKLRAEIKVAQLAGYVSEHAAYHHGEMSLNGTIINMAQDFVGANNINLLFPSGQFGTRLQGGKDAASPRYVFTRLEAITRALFHPEDDQLLTYLDDDGQSIEPEYYSPVLPMVLVNGSDGIGTGWSTFIPNYNPRDIIAALRQLLKGEEAIEELVPWYRGFDGTITAKVGKKGDDGSFTVNGCYREVDENTIEVTELPVRTWTQGYKQFLEAMLPGAPDSKEAGLVKDFKENHTDRHVSFTITFADGVYASMMAAPGGVMRKLKLESTISTNNMMLFNTAGQITKYTGAAEIIHEYFGPRLELYGSRKSAMVAKLESEHSKLSNQVRFILAVISQELVVSNRPKTALLDELQAMGYATFSCDKKEDAADEEGAAQAEAESSTLSKGYDYLLSMKLWSLTLERVGDLRAQLATKEAALAKLRATLPEDMWLADLDAVETALGDMDALMEADAENEERSRRKAQKGGKGKKASGKGKKARKSSDSDGSESDDSMSDDPSDDEWDDAPKKKRASKKAAAPKPPAPVAAAPAAVVGMQTMVPKKLVTKKVPSVAQKPPEPAAESSDEEVEVMSLADRMRMALAVSPPKKAARKNSDDDDDDVFAPSDSDEEFVAAKKPVAAKMSAASKPKTAAVKKTAVAAAKPAAAKPAAKKAAPKKKALSSDEDSKDFEDASEDEVIYVPKGTKRGQKGRVEPAAAAFSPGAFSPEVKKKPKTAAAKKAAAATAKPVAAKPAAKKAAQKKAAQKKAAPKKKVLSSDEEDSDAEEALEVKHRTPKPSRARKAIVYAVDSDDSDDFDSEPEESPDSEFDDE